MSEISKVTRSKAQARATYDAISKWYDAFAGGSEKRFCRLGLQALNAQPGETVLEIGFGTGNGVLALARSVGVSGKVQGIDISEGMRRLALAKVEKSGFSRRVELRCGDAIDLPYDAEVFDAVFMCFTLELFDTPEIPIVLHECLRVLRPEGRLCTVTMAKSEYPNLMSALYDWAHLRFPTYVDCRPIFAPQVLETSGYKIQKVLKLSMWGLPVEIILSENAMWKGNP